MTISQRSSFFTISPVEARRILREVNQQINRIESATKLVLDIGKQFIKVSSAVEELEGPIKSVIRALLDAGPVAIDVNNAGFGLALNCVTAHMNYVHGIATPQLRSNETLVKPDLQLLRRD